MSGTTRCEKRSGRGHDIQLHVHPQWQNAEYHDGRWKLTSDWSILNYSREEARRMLQRSKDYLENLLKEIDPDYRCVSFRSGAWCIAPSPHMLELLVELGIVFDMSIVAGVKYDTRNIKLDYTGCEEEFFVLENHTKDIQNFSDLERFLEKAAESSDIKFVTLTELARNLKQKFTIKMALFQKSTSLLDRVSTTSR